MVAFSIYPENMARREKTSFERDVERANRRISALAVPAVPVHQGPKVIIQRTVSPSKAKPRTCGYEFCNKTPRKARIYCTRSCNGRQYSLDRLSPEKAAAYREHKKVPFGDRRKSKDSDRWRLRRDGETESDVETRRERQREWSKTRNTKRRDKAISSAVANFIDIEYNPLGKDPRDVKRVLAKNAMPSSSGGRTWSLKACGEVLAKLKAERFKQNNRATVQRIIAVEETEPVVEQPILDDESCNGAILARSDGFGLGPKFKGVTQDQRTRQRQRTRPDQRTRRKRGIDSDVFVGQRSADQSPAYDKGALYELKRKSRRSRRSRRSR